MRQYVVQPGDSPASIAARDSMAGCPKCGGIDFVRANPHKEAIVHPNGFTTFKNLHVGETLNLPNKWFDGSLDIRPRSYFAALPHPDGVTPSTLGDSAAGVLGDYATLDAANAKVSVLATMSDQPFTAAVNDTADTIDAAVREVSGTGTPAVYAAPFAREVRKSTADARQKNAVLTADIAAGNQDAGFQDRSDILHSLSDAMVSARLALQAFYGDQPAALPPDTLTTTAQVAAHAINADPNYCAAVAQSGSAVNVAVHAFKTAWNSSQNPKIPINTGNYEQETAEAIASVLGGAPLPCEAHAVPSVPKPPTTLTSVVAAPRKEPLSVGAVAGIGLLVAATVAGAVYLEKTRPAGSEIWHSTRRRKRR